MAMRRRLQDRRAQGRRQDQRHQNRQDHGGYDGNGELPENNAGRPAKKGHRQKHRRQHQANADQRAADFIHGSPRSFLGRQPFILDESLDIFHHDNRVVDQQADRQNHTEQRQRIDGETGRVEDRQRAEQDDRHGNGGDERRTPVLQENEHDDKDKQDCFEQRMDNLLDRQGDELGIVDREIIFNPGWKILRQFVDARLHRVNGIERIGAGCQLHAETRRGMAIEFDAKAVIFGPKLDASDVGQQDDRPITVAAQSNILKLLGRPQSGLRRDGRVESLPFG